MHKEFIDPKTLELEEKLIHIGRVSKTVKGGRNFRFTALVVVGDRNGVVGKGLGKAAEIPDAIRKAIEAAKKDLIRVPMNGTTIHHGYLGEYGATQVLLKPAPRGTGVIAGGPVRSVLELCGVKDVRTKVIGSRTKNNVVNATMEALRNLRSPEDVAAIRDKSVEELR